MWHVVAAVAACDTQIPSKSMKVGTLDSLMALSDELQKVDSFVENVVKKCEKTLTDLLDKDTSAGLYVENQRSTYLVPCVVCHAFVLLDYLDVRSSSEMHERHRVCPCHVTCLEPEIRPVIPLP
jgi:hypothetical protein